MDEVARARADAVFRHQSDALCEALREVLNDDAEDWCDAPQVQAHALAETLVDVLVPAVEHDPSRIHFWLGVLEDVRLKILSVAATAKAARH